MRPIISDAFLEALHAWDLSLHAGASPRPDGFELVSLERHCESGKFSGHDDDYLAPVFDAAMGDRVNRSFRALNPTGQVAVKTHVLWSCYSPLTGLVVDWEIQRAHEALHAKLSEPAYENILCVSLKSMERVCE